MALAMKKKITSPADFANENFALGASWMIQLQRVLTCICSHMASDQRFSL